MIISRTPFRVSFFGGGTDYPVWYREHGGSVLSATINKFCYITCRSLPPFFDYRYRIRYFRDEKVSSIDEIQHPSVRECMRLLGIDQGLEIVHNADLPARSGLGSSSTFTVGMLHALYTQLHTMPTKRELALNALHVEQEMIQENVGSQDQTAAAFGGLNRIDFTGDSRHIMVTPIVVDPKRLMQFQRSLMLFFTGFSRTAHTIAGEQIKNTPKKKAQLHQMKDLVDESIDILMDKNRELEDFGRLLNEQWLIKRQMSHLISNDHLDEIYQAGIDAGALGGKLLGAGGGGFILFYVQPEKRTQLKKKLKNLLHVPFRIDDLGSQIIYYAKEMLY
ncbi:GHMP family kinase ATP-binding protein [Magnetococcales bacterium HHB-1]